MDQQISKSGTSKGLVAAILFVATYFVARIILKTPETSSTLRIIAALLPVVPFGWMLWEIISGIRLMDELEQRIQLEALIVAYPLAMILLLSLGMLELAIVLPPEDLSYRHVWAMLPVFYFIGLAIAKRRYQ